MKVCKHCNEMKSLESFSIQKGMRDGLRATCKPCNSLIYLEYCRLNPEKVRNSYYKKMYGITLDQYNEMYEKQKGVCKICWQTESAGNKSLAVDHDNKSGKIRSLLCHKCNAGLGHFNDSPALLVRAAQYISAHNGERFDLDV